MANTTAATRATPTGPWGLPAPAAAVESPPGGSEASRELETWRAGELESWRAGELESAFRDSLFSRGNIQLLNADFFATPAVGP